MLGQLPVSAAGHWGAPWPCKGQSLGEKKEQVAPAPCLFLSQAILYMGLCPVFSPLLFLLPDHSSGLKTFQQCLETPPAPGFQGLDPGRNATGSAASPRHSVPVSQLLSFLGLQILPRL